jgi:hypothetical protein
MSLSIKASTGFENLRFLDVEVITIEYLSDLNATLLVMKDPRGEDIVYYQAMLIEGDQTKKRYGFFRQIRDNHTYANLILRHIPSTQETVLQHRFVRKELRGNGLASNLFRDLLLKIQRSRVNIVEIRLSARQLNVIEWALKFGFLPCDSINQDKLEELQKYKNNEKCKVFERAIRTGPDQELELFTKNKHQLDENFWLHLSLKIENNDANNWTDNIISTYSPIRHRLGEILSKLST